MAWLSRRNEVGKKLQNGRHITAIIKEKAPENIETQKVNMRQLLKIKWKETKIHKWLQEQMPDLENKGDRTQQLQFF